MNYYGRKLIWNRYISQYQIDKMNKILETHISKNKELDKLYEISENRRSYLSIEEKRILKDELDKAKIY